MPFDFDVVGWKDYDDNRYDGKPDDINEVYGELVEAYDETTGQYEYFWALNPGQPFEDWDDWLDYIASMMSMYGLAM